MGRLIDKVRATGAVGEVKKREEEQKEKAKSQNEQEQRNAKLAERIIRELPKQLMEAAKAGQRTVIIDFPDNDKSLGALRKVEDWCKNESFSVRWENIEMSGLSDDYGSYRAFRLYISWPEEPSGK